MTFEEYINQVRSKRYVNVVLEMKDLYHSSTFERKSGIIYYVQIMIHGEVYTYLLEDGDTTFWTIDEHGNKKSRSCFSIYTFKHN